jgi:DNA-directed RNA polymerase subunit omega
VARVTIEDCLEQVPNRFSLIHLAFQRIKQLRAGADPLVQSKNKEVVVSLREIAAGKVSFPFESELNLRNGD